ncbi:hypothetical protein Acy02nite_39660 [Actinoplanes cyaneus]|uniref:IPT/TIG domain-containing protein n=1 Tax=Actinoplanes cyaneus TaxID=52696 RepID=A0A919IQ56_9ACTN|nr:IPT/TIG domain-containing protein [Actinoplanes cyaneus]MCW2139552.1 IPT/TIG domain-containing protein [Actinoplanes cyaneus]GID66085.1 hypothetical protein Acy02nite_39660 [Actinoplanes cyaneus]
MRKSKSRSKARLAAAAGLTTGAVGAALLAAPTAAFAAVTVSPPVVAVGGRVTVTDTDGVTFVTGSTTTANRVMILTAPGSTTPVCAATLPTASTTVLVATVASSDNTAKTVTFDMPAGATAGTNGQVKRYVACVYDTVGGSTARQGAQNGYPVYVGTAPTLNPPLGVTGGGNTVGVTTSTNVFSGVTTIGAQFATGVECPLTYGTPAASMSTTVSKTGDAAVNLTVPAGVTSTATTPTVYNMCFYNGTATSGALISSAQYSASQLSLSQAMGPWQGGNNINVTSPNQFLAGIDDPGVLFTSAACPAAYDDDAGTIKAVGPDNIRKLSNTRLATSVPANLYADQTTMNGALAVGATSVPWNVCVYSGAVDTDTPATSSSLVASNPYRVTTIQTVSGISPKAGPALGGSLVTVTGTAFPTDGTLTATLGGTALTDITPISTNAFTARIPRHAPANNVSLVVTTAGGSSTMASAFSYTSSLIAAPNTAPNNRAVEVVVKGVGFESAGWSDTLTSGAHIFLVKGNYSSVDISGTRANPPIADCNKVLVLSDIELICKLDLTTRLAANGNSLLDSVAPTALGGTPISAAGSRLITGGSFTSADIGKAVVDTDAAPVIPAGTVITDVMSNGTTAVLSNAATGVLTAAGVFLVSPFNRQVSIVTTSAASGAVTAAAGTFLTTDQTKYVVGTNVTTPRTIGTVNSGTSVTLSGNASAGNGTASTTAVIAATNIPVPEGAYNLQYVSNAASGAVTSDPAYVKSQISSTSTFTVAAF